MGLFLDVPFTLLSFIHFFIMPLTCEIIASSHHSHQPPPSSSIHSFIPWKRNSCLVDADLVKGRWQERPEYRRTSGVVLTTVAAMQQRIARILSCRDGYFNTRNFIYGPQPGKMCLLLNQALLSTQTSEPPPHGATNAVSPSRFFFFMVRSVKIDLCQFDNDENKNKKNDSACVVQGLAHLLATSPLLSSIEWDGSEGDSPHILRRLAVLMEGLSRNHYNRLVKMTFIETYLGQEKGSFASREGIIQALQQVDSLQEVSFYFCSMDLVQLVSQGLYQHEKLHTVRLVSRYNANDVVPFLQSLPNLQSLHLNCLSGCLALALPDIMPRLQHFSLQYLDSRQDYVSVATALLRAQRLQGLQLHSFLETEPTGIQSDQQNQEIDQGQDKEESVLGRVLAELPRLESLSLSGIHDTLPRSIIRCAHLKHLDISGLENDNQSQLVLMRSLLQTKKEHQQALLETISFGQMSEDEWRETLERLENNSSVTSVCLRPPEIDAGLFYPLRRTLQSSQTLKKLQLRFHPRLVPVLMNLMENNTCTSLEHLCLDQVEPDAAIFFRLPALLKSLLHNTTLQGLALNLNSHSPLVFEKLWESLLQLIRQNSHLRKLVLRSLSDKDDETPINTDELALALNENSTLTTVQILLGGRPRPPINFVCRLYNRRNRIQKMVRDKQISDALWPQVLESLVPNPSAIFLTMRYIPWPSRCLDTTGTSFQVDS